MIKEKILEIKKKAIENHVPIVRDNTIQKVIEILKSKTLSVWVHNKTIQKAVESFRISPQQKEYLKTLKR